MGQQVRAVMLGTVFAAIVVTNAAAAEPRFVRGLSVALPGPPGKVVAGEFSGDRHPDVVVAAGDLVLLRNAGDGGLVRSRLLAIPKAAASTPEGYQDVIAGDLNGDGVQDLVALADLQVPERVVGQLPSGRPITLSTSAGARTLLGRRGGRPAPATLITLPVNVSSPQLADVDGDGRLDLVFSATPDARYASGGGSALFVARGRADPSRTSARCWTRWARATRCPVARRSRSRTSTATAASTSRSAPWTESGSIRRSAAPAPRLVLC